jgi:hypothetical protein
MDGKVILKCEICYHDGGLWNNFAEVFHDRRIKTACQQCTEEKMRIW